jgi:predicted RNA binding protein YcfA (HicA-like mRNA interferase family)
VPPRPLPYREVKRRLEAAGFAEINQRGSHVKFAKQTEHGLRTAIVPRHREIAAGTLRSILSQVGLRWDDFDQL